MNPVTYHLCHDRYDGWQDHDKLLGIYSTKEKAEAALALLRHKPGFRDHPDGFEVLDGPIDETYWLEGFLSLWGDEEPDPNHVPGSGKRVLFTSIDPMPQTYWVLWHRYAQEAGIFEEKLIGTYTSRENAEKGIELVRDQPGFREHLNGFVITEGTLDQTDMIDGFITVREDNRERDEPICDATQES
ncbi:MAG TPA: hypothetical protein VFX06_11520 [Stellaceae bacterium]|nr:hypothetical protein [Stellaceae bacterium]